MSQPDPSSPRSSAPLASGRVACLILVAICLAAAPVMARPTIRTSFFNAYPSAVGSRLDNLPSIQGHCGVCHYQFTGAGPKNPYGQLLESVLPNFPNNDNGRQQAMHSIENLDSDGDGFTQLVEITDQTHFINTPTFPGLTPGNVNLVSGVNQNDILPYLVPTTGIDTVPPEVTVISPNGGQSWEGGSAHSVTWTAQDNVGVTGVDLFYREGASEPWTMFAQGLGNSGSFAWFVHNTPTSEARVRVVARDALGNQGEDQSNANFSILLESGGIAPTSLRDFHQPGSQPFDADAFQDRTACAGCHGGYDPAVEPDWNFQGSMMAQAARDPIFFACLAIANEDAPSAGDMCLRCHTPMGWLSGRSNPTDGGALNALDRDGVSCDFCHRMVDPIYQPGVSPVEDQAVLDALDDVPATYSNGQFVDDPQARRRGPFDDAVPPHAFLYSPFHRSANFCGTCHDVSNPVFVRTGDRDYAPGPLDQEADSISSAVLMPLERTFSEWLNSDYPDGVYAPEFAGNRPDGMVYTCQDCHMRAVEGEGCNDPNAPTRPDLPLHDMMGGNTWMPGIVPQIYPDEVDPAALADGAARALSMLEKAAHLEVTLTSEADSVRADVQVTNETGHKLPTGYPEGRRMWINLKAYDEAQHLIYESGAYDPATGTLLHDPEIRIYDAELGLSPGLAQALGLPAGVSFHFALNDTLYKDNRIPPRGFTNAAFMAFGGAPVEPEHPGQRYADGQHWDTAPYHLPEAAHRVVATLFYQTTSKEYVEFLRDMNTTNDDGQLMYDLWASNGRAAPVAMVADSATVGPSTVADGGTPLRFHLEAVPNPAIGDVALRFDVPRPAAVRLEIFDAGGRRVRMIDGGLIQGAQAMTWNRRDDRELEVGSGVYWVRLTAGKERLSRALVILR